MVCVHLVLVIAAVISLKEKRRDQKGWKEINQAFHLRLPGVEALGPAGQGLIEAEDLHCDLEQSLLGVLKFKVKGRAQFS